MRSKDGHQAIRRSGRTPWDGPSDDGASDEVQIIAGSEVKELRGDELNFGSGKNQIYVTKDVEVSQNDV